MQRAIKLSIIIVNWNTCEMLASCLQSVQESLARFPLAAGAAAEILVVDNASRDGSAAMLQARFPDVRLIHNRFNVGFACANNKAIVQSQGEYILLLNPDTVVHDDGLAQLVQFLDAHPQAGVAGSRLLNPDGSLQVSCAPFPTLSRELWRMLHLDRLSAYGVCAMHRWSLEQPRQVDAVQGASLLVRRALLDQVGLLDEEYFMYTEEIDLCYRIHRAGWQIYWVPASRVTHYGGQSTRLVASDMFLHLYLSKVQYVRKHHGAASANLYKVVLAGSGLLRLLVSPLAWLQRPAVRRGKWRLARNYGRLLLTLPQM
jgi:GT2 family glycosyltransferase